MCVVPAYERSNELVPRLFSHEAEQCPFRDTCMSAGSCNGSCWFREGDFDLGIRGRMKNIGFGEVYVDAERIGLLRNFACRWRELSGCGWREVANILDAPVSTVYELASGKRKYMEDEVVQSMFDSLEDFVARLRVTCSDSANPEKGVVCNGR